jgi:hypothetical protein
MKLRHCRAGVYKVVVKPVGSATGSLTLKLSEMPPDVNGTIAVGGAGVPVTVSTADRRPC